MVVGPYSTTVTVPALPASEPEVEEEVEEEVEPEVDTTLPNLVVSNNLPGIPTTNPNGIIVYYASPSATDIGGIVGLSCDWPSGTFFSVGTTTVTCTAVDTAGNMAIASFTITVVYSVEADTTLPVFVHVDDIETSSTNPEGIVYNYAIPQVSDNIGVTIGPTCTPPPGSIFLIGITNVVCTAGDAAGNVGNTTFSVTVVNPNATGGIPTFEPIVDISEEADVPNGKMVLFPTPIATDDETESPLVFCTPSSGTFFPLVIHP
uniref:Hyalin n=1 Tax=uncultured marine thaumarchaeote SAT1000_04_F07 TaxID=1456355 RepID=A0A075I0F5_9ARCH|nr:hyalin [uncultured marine thaumarchaeote SAT1000_04_F07]